MTPLEPCDSRRSSLRSSPSTLPCCWKQQGAAMTQDLGCIVVLFCSSWGGFGVLCVVVLVCACAAYDLSVFVLLCKVNWLAFAVSCC